MACLQNKRAHWSFRLQQELKNSQNAYFITLTYDDQKIPLEQVGEETYLQTVYKRDVQLFIKRLRKASKSKLRYYLASEYGEHTFRPHYHAIIFNVGTSYEQAARLILDSWQNGFVKVGSVTPASIHYVTKYSISKNFVPDGSGKNFALMSKGLGKCYIEKCRRYHDGILDHFHVKYEGGFLGSLPRYYAERLYSKEEREQWSSKFTNKVEDPKEMYPNDPNPFKRLSDVKEHFSRIVEQSSKSKNY